MSAERRERPILFQGAMVRALLAGTKTQTRRLVKPHTVETMAERGIVGLRCPYGVAGDRLWVRETFDAPPGSERIDEVAYRADFAQDPEGATWRPSIFMPRWASRITLEVTAVRAERLHSLSEEDAIAEGITGPHMVGYPAFKVPEDSKPRYSSAVAAFEALWDSINHERAPWASNPWVWVVGFRRLP